MTAIVKDQQASLLSPSKVQLQARVSQQLVTVEEQRKVVILYVTAQRVA